MVIGQLIHCKRVPCDLVPGLDIAGKDAIPELQFVQLRCGRVFAPYNTYIEHIQMVIRQSVHSTIVVVMPVRNDHARNVVSELRFDMIDDIIKWHVERGLPDRRLLWFFLDFGHVLNVAWQVISVPKRHNEPGKADKDQYVICALDACLWSANGGVGIQP